MARRSGVVVALLAVLVAGALLWRCHGKHEEAGPSSGSSATSAGGGANGATDVRSKRIDPRKQPKASISGVITDEAHAPVAAIRVCADPESENLPTSLIRDPRCVVSDAAGHYTVGDLPAAEYAVFASGKPYRPSTFLPTGDRHHVRFKLKAGEAKTGVDLVMRAGGVEVHGTVSDISGGPVAHALVRASAEQRQSDEANIETDDAGKFSLYVGPGRVHVTAVADGYAEAGTWGRAPGKFDLLLTPESILSGTVVDAKSNEPIEGARVTIGDGDWAWGGTSDISDEQGRFKVAAMTPGRLVAAARTEHGYGRTEGSVLVGLGQHVDGVVVKVYPAQRVVAKLVVTGSDKPVPCEHGGASLEDKADSRWVQMHQDEDKTVVADAVLPGTYYPQVWCDGYQAHDKYAPITIKDGDATATWEVDPGATVKGRVVDKRGKPVPDVYISLRSTGAKARSNTRWEGDSTGPDGTYEIKGVMEGTYNVSVDTDAGVPPNDDEHQDKIEVPKSGALTHDVTLDDGGTIDGLIVDADGKPVKGIDVRAQPTKSSGSFIWQRGEQAKSDDDGAFHLDALHAGEYNVTAQRTWNDQLRKPGTTDDAKQGEKATVTNGTTAHVRIVVESQSASIAGTVVDEKNQPVTDAYLSAARESDAAGARKSSVEQTRGWWMSEDKPVLTGTDGAFTINELSPGKYTVRAYRKGGGEAVVEHVATGTPAHLQIKPTGTMAGTAKPATGDAPLEIDVSVADPAIGFDRSEHFFQTGGRFNVKDLPAGHFKVTVSCANGEKMQEVDLAEAEQKTGVDFVLDSLVTITGRVVDIATKAPVPGMMMMASSAAGGDRFSFSMGGDGDNENVTDENGQFKVLRAARTKLVVRGFPKDFMGGDSNYGFIMAVRDATGASGDEFDVGDVVAIKQRVKRGGVTGELGVHFAQADPGAQPDQITLTISFIDPAGPAAKTALKVGDVVTQVDGIDVTGANAGNGYALLRVPPGDKVTLTTKGGTSATIVAAQP
ncbi:MAG TPA: carboxypeptidase regulatory-like domain-containing protein [Kofleriaceae bacterium]|jgi:protocatechuate 3,4-dioxygenase beta subunit